VTCLSVQDGLEQICVGAGVGERENELFVIHIETEKHLIVFDVVVAESGKNRSALHITLDPNFNVNGLIFGKIRSFTPLTRYFGSAAPVQLPSSRRNVRIRWFGISTTRKRLAPSIRLRNQSKGIRSKTK